MRQLRRSSTSGAVAASLFRWTTRPNARSTDLFGRIAGESGRLDVLVNNVWHWGPPSDYTAPSWDQPVERWDAMFGVGVRSHFVTTRGALPLLLEGERGLVVSTQERPGNDDRFGQNIVVDAAAIVMQRMIRYLGRELADTTVSAALLYFGWVRTVNLGMGFDPAEVGMSQTDFEAVTQSPYMTGRAVAALAADRDVQARSGQTLTQVKSRSTIASPTSTAASLAMRAALCRVTPAEASHTAGTVTPFGFGVAGVDSANSAETRSSRARQRLRVLRPELVPVRRAGHRDGALRLRIDAGSC